MASSIERRFLLMVCGALLIVVAPLFALFLVLSSQQIANSQTLNLNALITANSQALAKPLWDIDVESIEQVLGVLATDPVVVKVNVRDTSGLFDITRSNARLPSGEPLASMTRPIHYKSPGGPRHVGWVEIQYVPAGLFSAFDSFNIMLSAIFLIAILVVCGAAVFGNRLMIMKPLMKLAGAIDATRLNGSRHHVDWRSNDEIGKLARNFNDMQTQLESEEMALKAAHEHTREIYDSTPAMLFSSDRQGNVTAVSDYWLVATGYERETVIGRPFSALLNPQDRAAYEACLHTRGPDGAACAVTVRFMRADAGEMDVQITSAQLPDASARSGGMLSVMTDVTELRRSEQINRHQAITDHLTGLLNRQGFEMAIETGMQDAQAEGTELACLFIDLDRFKSINDSMGHAAGDAVLKQFVERLHSVLSAGEIAARLGGDEFSVLASGAQASRHAPELAARIVSLFEAPFLAAGREVRLSASIGLALYPQQASTAAELLQKSDMAMYTRKRSGKNGAHVFDPAMQADALRHSEIEADIEKALRHGWFEVHFQSIHDLCAQEVRGFEALLRLRHPEKGLLPPAEIIRVAEETGSIGRIGSVVLEKSMEKLVLLSALPLLRNAYVAVNFSALQFDPGLAARIATLIAQHRLQPNRLVVEITEAVLMDDNPQIRTTLEEISRFGCRIALDDFGTGYSSLSYLNRFPVNIVKIDQSFVRSASDPSREIAAKSRMLIEGITAISHKMNCRVIAEGVETEEQRLMLLETGVDYGQGYRFRKPTAPAELYELYKLSEKAGGIAG